MAETRETILPNDVVGRNHEQEFGCREKVWEDVDFTDGHGLWLPNAQKKVAVVLTRYRLYNAANSDAMWRSKNLTRILESRGWQVHELIPEIDGSHWDERFDNVLHRVINTGGCSVFHLSETKVPYIMAPIFGDDRVDNGAWKLLCEAKQQNPHLFNLYRLLDEITDVAMTHDGFDCGNKIDFGRILYHKVSVEDLHHLTSDAPKKVAVVFTRYIGVSENPQMTEVETQLLARANDVTRQLREKGWSVHLLKCARNGSDWDKQFEDVWRDFIMQGQCSVFFVSKADITARIMKRDRTWKKLCEEKQRCPRLFYFFRLVDDSITVDDPVDYAEYHYEMNELVLENNLDAHPHLVDDDFDREQKRKFGGKVRYCKYDSGLVSLLKPGHGRRVRAKELYGEDAKPMILLSTRFGTHTITQSGVQTRIDATATAEKVAARLEKLGWHVFNPNSKTHGKDVWKEEYEKRLDMVASSGGCVVVLTAPNIPLGNAQKKHELDMFIERKLQTQGNGALFQLCRLVTDTETVVMEAGTYDPNLNITQFQDKTNRQGYRSEQFSRTVTEKSGSSTRSTTWKKKHITSRGVHADGTQYTTEKTSTFYSSSTSRR